MIRINPIKETFVADVDGVDVRAISPGEFDQLYRPLLRSLRIRVHRGEILGQRQPRFLIAVSGGVVETVQQCEAARVEPGLLDALAPGCVGRVLARDIALARRRLQDCAGRCARKITECANRANTIRT